MVLKPLSHPSGSGFGRTAKIVTNLIILLEKFVQSGNRGALSRQILNRRFERPIQDLRC